MSKQRTTCWQKWFLWIVKTTVAKSIQKDFYERPLMGELCVETLKILPLFLYTPYFCIHPAIKYSENNNNRTVEVSLIINTFKLEITHFKPFH